MVRGRFAMEHPGPLSADLFTSSGTYYKVLPVRRFSGFPPDNFMAANSEGRVPLNVFVPLNQEGSVVQDAADFNRSRDVVVECALKLFFKLPRTTRARALRGFQPKRFGRPLKREPLAPVS
jgi:hypothetical protein